jgi:protein-tyrosine phosphatase
MESILITVCLQNDFLMPIGKYDNLPNLLHVGYEESNRIMGLNPNEGPISLFMNWSNSIPDQNLKKIHIRDWHDAEDNSQKTHLRQFGEHCLMNTKGAEFVFNTNGKETIINSTGLNDFIGHSLDNHLSPYKDKKIRIGIIGVWTEAKVFFLAYDIITRYPQFEVAICSAITASSSLHNHYASLDQLRRILNVHVYDSIGEFTNFLSHNKQGLEIALKEGNHFPSLVYDKSITLSSTDIKLIKYVFRNSKSVELKVLDGGFSGNAVLSAKSIDLNGHLEAPHVLKIGAQELIGRERMSFEKIEQVLGNNAPRITDFADSLGRGILKYRYASMGKGTSSSFQKLYMNDISLKKVKKYLDTIFLDQLGRFYIASTHEKINFFEYYGFTNASVERISKNIKEVYGSEATDDELEIIKDVHFPNPLFFYKNDLKNIAANSNGYAHLAYVHGDLNGANIIIDAQENLWIIDFFHTHRGHIIKDLVKLENDLLYIYTPIANINDFKDALKISEVLFSTSDLAEPLPELSLLNIVNPSIKRTYETLRILRSYYPNLIKMDRNPTQLFIAQLRYAMHTLIFDESNIWQRKWALYNAGHFCKIITKRTNETGALRVDFIPEQYLKNRLGMTILPGRQDYSRSLEEDIKELKLQKIDVIIPLVTQDEMERYGVPDLIEKYLKANFEVKHLPIIDQKAPQSDEINDLIEYIDLKFKEGKNLLVHCVGGLGRSGLVVACFLKSKGLSSEDAISAVRKSRSARAIETKIQEEFIEVYN